MSTYRYFLCIIFATAVPSCFTKKPPQTCQPQPALVSLVGDVLGIEELSQNDGFKICLFNRTNDLVTDIVGEAGNTLWFLQNLGAYILGDCFCRQDCTPSQIVCNNPGVLDIFEDIVPGVDFMDFNILNGIAQFVYRAEQWQFYCYCPSLIPKGVDPCIRPPNPSVCEP
ncbi:uncharacterized protein LOC110852041 [Folsomia candida]|uniref:Uncharacterized protein n=1 Tax=Folsomia candida TaxID=158441 RepID=A0A226E4H3_FOLCA|nr:uncharacterized protein LOC110852041 [Folsomia candida]OXA51811.1 hypothetical protein Fcan01_13607 [Folsomia candida]